MEDESLKDAALIDRCRVELPHTLDAYRALLCRYEPLVYRTCLRMLGNEMDAEEVCQDAFLQVYHKLDRFEGRSAFKTWFFRIVYNLCLDRRRSLARRQKQEHRIAEAITQGVNGEEEHASDEVLTTRVHEAIDRMTGDDRRILILRHVSGLELAEISQVLEIGLSATKMRLYRAQEKFKESYSQLLEADGLKAHHRTP